MRGSRPGTSRLDSYTKPFSRSTRFKTVFKTRCIGNSFRRKCHHGNIAPQDQVRERTDRRHPPMRTVRPLLAQTHTGHVSGQLTGKLAGRRIDVYRVEMDKVATVARSPPPRRARQKSGAARRRVSTSSSSIYVESHSIPPTNCADEPKNNRTVMLASVYSSWIPQTSRDRLKMGQERRGNAHALAAGVNIHHVHMAIVLQISKSGRALFRPRQ